MSNTETKAVLVTLKSIPSKKDGKPKSKKFEIKRANELLSMKKSAWTLDDKNFVFNGTEIAKATK